MEAILTISMTRNGFRQKRSDERALNAWCLRHLGFTWRRIEQLLRLKPNNGMTAVRAYRHFEKTIPAQQGQMNKPWYYALPGFSGVSLCRKAIAWPTVGNEDLARYTASVMEDTHVSPEERARKLRSLLERPAGIHRHMLLRELWRNGLTEEEFKVLCTNKKAGGLLPKDSYLRLKYHEAAAYIFGRKASRSLTEHLREHLGLGKCRAKPTIPYVDLDKRNVLLPVVYMLKKDPDDIRFLQALKGLLLRKRGIIYTEALKNYDAWSLR